MRAPSRSANDTPDLANSFEDHVVHLRMNLFIKFHVALVSLNLFTSVANTPFSTWRHVICLYYRRSPMKIFTSLHDGMILVR